VKGIVEAPALCNVTELRSFLGLINYYGKFLPDLATTLSKKMSWISRTTQYSQPVLICWKRPTSSIPKCYGVKVLPKLLSGRHKDQKIQTATLL